MGPTTRFLVFACVSLAIGAHCQAQTAPGLDVPTADLVSRLRPADTFLAGVIEEGVCRSTTLRSMVAALQASDVIVYVTMRPLSDWRVWGGLQFIGATATDRVLRVVLRFPLDRIARMAMLGHELRHAIEVAGIPDIRSQKALEDYYRAHGIPGFTGSTFETDAARRTELRVRQEVTTLRISCGGVQPAGN